MRLNVRKINNYSYYSIIKDYTTLSGKRTTKIFEKLGNQQQVEERIYFFSKQPRERRNN